MTPFRFATYHLLPCLVLLLVACSAPREDAPVVSREGCEPRPTPGGGSPVSDPNGPWSHQVVVARTTDGVTLEGARQILDHASVPDGVALQDGRVLLYYINAETGAIHVAKVAGETIEHLGAISIDDAAAPMGAVDPDAVLLPNGKVRLFYLGNLGPPQPGTGKPWYICAADSEDGVRFTLVGLTIQFADEQTTDPSVTRLGDGSWLMAASQGPKTVLARSKDGLSFEQYASVDYGGVPEVSSLKDGRSRLYVCARGIESYVSADRGATWTKEATNIAPNLGKAITCDPSWVPGANLFFYKTGGGPPPRP